MGKRSEWTVGHLSSYMDIADGHFATAAKLMNEDYPSRDKVTRQNLQTWVNDLEEPEGETPVADIADQHELLRKNRLLTNTNNALRREQRKTLDAQLTKDNTLQAIATAVHAATIPTVVLPNSAEKGGGRDITIELLFSDLQVGKLMDDYNTGVARRRVDEWLEVALARITQYELLGYNIDKIILSILGDVIESDKKHDNSGRACDSGTADQMKVAIELLFEKVLVGLSSVGVPMDIIMITGNHDHDGHGLNMFMPGREHLSWPMYHAIRMMSEQAGLRTTFYIPEGSFLIYDLYGQKVLYEHGVGVATSEVAMKKHVSNRMAQIKSYISLFRMGDKHNICRFNNDRFTVNGAFFGDSRKGEEYSGIAGYDGEPAQIMFAHVKREDDFRTSIFDSLVIQLGHIK